VTQGKGEGIGLVLRRGCRQGEQQTYHVLDLGLLRAPGAHYGELNRLGAVLVNLYVFPEPGAEHGAPGLTELEGGGHIAGEDELFHHHLMGSVLSHNLGDVIEESAQPLRPRQVSDPDTAAGDPHAPGAVRIDHAESGDAGAGVDAQNPVAQSGPG